MSEALGIDVIKKRINDSRFYWKEFGEFSFKVKKLLSIELNLFMEEMGYKTILPDDPEGEIKILPTSDIRDLEERSHLLSKYVTGWKGVLLKHVSSEFESDEGDQAAPWDTDLFEMLMLNDAILGGKIVNEILVSSTISIGELIESKKNSKDS